MKIFYQCLSILLCLQLAVGCNSFKSSISVDPLATPGDQRGGLGSSFNFSGSFAGLFHRFSEALLGSAYAQEGDMVFYDLTDPLSPQELRRKPQVGLTFSESFDASEVEGKIIRVRFESYLSTAQNRELLVEVPPAVEGQEVVVASNMNSTTTLESQVIERQLVTEYQRVIDSGSEVFDIKTRLGEIKIQNQDLSEELILLGENSDLLATVSAGDFNKIELIASFAAYQRIAFANNNFGEVLDIQRKAYHYFIENKIAPEQVRFNCSSAGAAISGLLHWGGRSFKMKVLVTDPALITAGGITTELGVATSYEQLKLAQIKLKQELVDLSAALQKSVSVILEVTDIIEGGLGVNRCPIFSDLKPSSEAVNLVSNLALPNYEPTNSFYQAISFAGVNSFQEGLAMLIQADLSSRDELLTRISSMPELNSSPGAIDNLVEQKEGAFRELFKIKYRELVALKLTTGNESANTSIFSNSFSCEALQTMDAVTKELAVQLNTQLDNIVGDASKNLTSLTLSQKQLHFTEQFQIAVVAYDLKIIECISFYLGNLAPIKLTDAVSFEKENTEKTEIAEEFIYNPLILQKFMIENYQDVETALNDVESMNNELRGNLYYKLNTNGINEYTAYEQYFNRSDLIRDIKLSQISAYFTHLSKLGITNSPQVGKK